MIIIIPVQPQISSLRKDHVATDLTAAASYFFEATTRLEGMGCKKKWALEVQ